MTEKRVRSEEPAPYLTSLNDDELIRQAIRILEARLAKPEAYMTSPDQVREYLRLKVATIPYEVFGVMYLDNRHGLIAAEELFRGTIDGASVYAREVVREVIRHNAAAVIFYHNHPSGVDEPSQADQRITQRLKDALAMIEVRALDHFIVGRDSVMSFAERGML